MSTLRLTSPFPVAHLMPQLTWMDNYMPFASLALTAMLLGFVLLHTVSWHVATVFVDFDAVDILASPSLMLR